MLGFPSCVPLFSLIFEVRTLIFGQNYLCPYVGRGFERPEYLKKLHFDRFFMDHPLRFSRYNDHQTEKHNFNWVKTVFWPLSGPFLGSWSLIFTQPTSHWSYIIPVGSGTSVGTFIETLQSFLYYIRHVSSKTTHLTFIMVFFFRAHFFSFSILMIFLFFGPKIEAL